MNKTKIIKRNREENSFSSCSKHLEYDRNKNVTQNDRIIEVLNSNSDINSVKYNYKAI